MKAIKYPIYAAWLAGYCALLTICIPIGMVVSIVYRPFKAIERNQWTLND